MLTIIEFLYCFIVGLIAYLHKRLSSSRKNKNKTEDPHSIQVLPYNLSSCRKEKNKTKYHHSIQALPYDEKKVFPLLDFPIAANKKKLLN